jgi:drug/metabolite transporter (DMT)-like permease
MYEIIIPLLVAICFGISAAYQKYSMKDSERFSFRELLKNKKWLLAMGIGAIGILLYLFALTFITITAVQPMLALSIIIPIIAGVVFFSEKIGYLEAASITIIIIGLVLFVV